MKPKWSGLMNSEERWLGYWVSTKLFGLITYNFYYDSDGYPKDTPEWVEIRENEVRNNIKYYEKSQATAWRFREFVHTFWLRYQ